MSGAGASSSRLDGAANLAMGAENLSAARGRILRLPR